MKLPRWRTYLQPNRNLSQISQKLLLVRQKEGEQVYWAAIRKELKENLWFLMRFALAFDFLDEKLIGTELLTFYADNSGKDTLALIPRGHCKTVTNIGRNASYIINDPHIAILYFTATEDNAEKFGQTLAETLMHNEVLQRCFGTAYNKHPENCILPSKANECRQWSNSGYTLPNRRPRMDPTFLSLSMKASKVGKHPDIINLDDLTDETNNTPEQWAKTVRFIQECWPLLPAHGFFDWTGTIWADGDPATSARDGRVIGKQGKFNTIVRSCYIDDDPTKGLTYPWKVRGNMPNATGYTEEILKHASGPVVDGGMGAFFDCQMRNNPKPPENRDLDVEAINIYEPGEEPPVKNTIEVGLEVTGGGAPIYERLKEWLSENRFIMPTAEITHPVKEGPKHDRIVATLEPAINSGRIYAQQWMIGDESSRDNLGYEIRRLRAAAHDDIVDALYNAVDRAKGHLVKHDGLDVFISVDLAWSKAIKADYIAAIAVGLDKEGKQYILDYIRFRTPSPSAVANKIYEFYRRFEQPRTKNKKKFPGCWK